MNPTYKLTKLIRFHVLLLVFTFYSCGLDHSEPMLAYRSSITVETNSDSLRIDNAEGSILLNKNSIYPYKIVDTYSDMELAISIRVYPVFNTGYIKFKLYSAEAFDNPTPYLRDSLTILTPIDTTDISFRSGAGYDTIIVNPKL